MDRFKILKGVIPLDTEIKDNLGRIVQLNLGSDCHGGHSVCNKCGKDMPGCWDVVCFKCNKTFYCEECKRNK